MLFLNPGEPQLALLMELTSRYVVTSTAFFFPLALVNIVRFSIQGMGYSAFAILAGVLEMLARTGVGYGPGACVWVQRSLLCLPGSLDCR